MPRTAQPRVDQFCKAEALPDDPFRFELRPPFDAVAVEAVARLQYLHPAATIAIVGDHIAVSNVEATDALRRDVAYTLYRAKIAADGKPLREMLQSAVLAR